MSDAQLSIGIYMDHLDVPETVEFPVSQSQLSRKPSYQPSDTPERSSQNDGPEYRCLPVDHAGGSSVKCLTCPNPQLLRAELQRLDDEPDVFGRIHAQRLDAFVQPCSWVYAC